MAITFADGRNDLVLTVYADARIENIIKRAVLPDDTELTVKFNGRVQSRISQLKTLSPDIADNSEVRLELFKGWLAHSPH